jgi:hypothetical protein
LKGVAAYVGDKALGGVIGRVAVAAAFAVAGRLAAPSPMPVTRTVRVIQSITLGIAEEHLPLSEHLAIELIRGNDGVA